MNEQENMHLVSQSTSRVNLPIIGLPPVDAPVRQGDVLRLLGTSFERPYECAYAIVLTADCDLAQDKHYGQFLLCPIVPISHYLRDDWAKRRIVKVRAAALEKIRTELESISNLAEQGDVSVEVVELLTTSVESMEMALKGVPIAEAAKAKVLRNVQVALECNGGNETDQLQKLARAVAVRDDISTPNAIAKICKEFRTEMKADNADIVVLPDEAQSSNAASVLLLRHPFSVAARDVGTTASDGRPILRAGRLCQEVKYLTAQKFGHLFSRFGMPRAIEIDRDAAVDIEDLER